MVGFEDAAWTKGARQNNFTFGCWPMWRTHSCVPRRHSCRRPVNRGEEASRRVSELLKSPRVLGLPGENDLSQSPHVPWEGKLKHAPPRRKPARLVGHALACPSILGLITNSIFLRPGSLTMPHLRDWRDNFARGRRSNRNPPGAGFPPGPDNTSPRRPP